MSYSNNHRELNLTDEMRGKMISELERFRLQPTFDLVSELCQPLERPKTIDLSQCVTRALSPKPVHSLGSMRLSRLGCVTEPLSDTVSEDVRAIITRAIEKSVVNTFIPPMPKLSGYEAIASTPSHETLTIEEIFAGVDLLRDHIAESERTRARMREVLKPCIVTTPIA